MPTFPYSRIPAYWAQQPGTQLAIWLALQPKRAVYPPPVVKSLFFFAG